jgi:hypothetical protein
LKRIAESMEEPKEHSPAVEQADPHTINQEIKGEDDKNEPDESERFDNPDQSDAFLNGDDLIVDDAKMSESTVTRN